VPRYIAAQVSFIGTLWDDGTVTVTEYGSKRDGYLRKPEHYSRQIPVSGDWDVEQLPYALWEAMEEEV